MSRRIIPAIVLALSCSLVLSARSLTDEEISALIQADDYEAIRAAIGSTPGWTTRVLSIFEEQGDLLTMAAMNGAPRTVAGLLRDGANVDGEPAMSNGANVWGFTPLYAAARAGHANVVAQLLAAGAATMREDNAGFGPLHVAAAFGRVDVMKLILDAKVPIDTRAMRGDTPLKLAAMRNQAEGVTFLLSKHADPNLADVRGDTSLHEAARNNSAAIAEALLSHGARLLPNRYGRTPFDEANDWAPDLLEMLKSRLADRQ